MGKRSRGRASQRLTRDAHRSFDRINFTSRNYGVPNRTRVRLECKRSASRRLISRRRCVIRLGSCLVDAFNPRTKLIRKTRSFRESRTVELASLRTVPALRRCAVSKSRIEISRKVAQERRDISLAHSARDSSRAREPRSQRTISRAATKTQRKRRDGARN